jgi:hypothetical protein
MRSEEGPENCRNQGLWAESASRGLSRNEKEKSRQSEMFFILPTVQKKSKKIKIPEMVGEIESLKLKNLE